MKAFSLAFTAPLQAALVERDLPPLKLREILIEAEASLISPGTERHFFNGAPYYPFFPGYSLVGRVVDVAPGVTAFKMGDRVAASAPHGSLVACDERMAFTIPEDLPAQHAAFLTVGATALYSVKLAELKIGDPLMIVGQGLIGLIATQIARHAGALPVIGIDINQSRLDLARSLGADIVLDARDTDGIAAALAALPGRGVAATIDLSAAPDALERAIGYTRRRGRVVAASLSPGGGNVAMYGEAFGKGVAVVGAYFNARPWRLVTQEVTPPTDWPISVFDATDFEGNEVGTSAGDTAAVLNMIAHGRIDVAALISDAVAPADAPELFAKLPTSGFLGGVINWRA